SRPCSTTSQPSFASASATPRPMPRLDPVTSATLPASPSSMSVLPPKLLKTIEIGYLPGNGRIAVEAACNPGKRRGDNVNAIPGRLPGSDRRRYVRYGGVNQIPGTAARGACQ